MQQIVCILTLTGRHLVVGEAGLRAGGIVTVPSHEPGAVKELQVTVEAEALHDRQDIMRDTVRAVEDRQLAEDSSL